MARHSFPYGVFNVGRYKSGPLKGRVYVQDNRGRFVGGDLRKRVLKDVFGPKKPFRITVGNGVSATGLRLRITYQKWSRRRSELTAARVGMELLVLCRTVDFMLTDAFTRETPRALRVRLTRDGNPPTLVPQAELLRSTGRTRAQLIEDARRYIEADGKWTLPDPNVEGPTRMEEAGPPGDVYWSESVGKGA